MWVYGLDRSGPGQRQVADAFECGNEPSGSVKCGEFLDQLQNSQLLKKDSAPWSKKGVNILYAFYHKIQRSVVSFVTFMVFFSLLTYLIIKQRHYEADVLYDADTHFREKQAHVPKFTLREQLHRHRNVNQYSFIKDTQMY